MTDLATWQNLIFLIPGALALVLLLISSAFSAGSDDGADDAGGEADADGETDDEVTAEFALSSLVGADKAPLTLVLGVLMLSWGVVGYWANQLLSPTIHKPASLVCATMPIALIAAILITRTAAGLIGRFAPKLDTAAVSRASLVGQEAKVVYPVSETTGRAYHYDSHGILHDVSCRTHPGKPVIAKGETVILTGFDETKKAFWAELSPFDAP